MFCFVTLHSEIFTIISTKGDQLDGFTYLVACHGYIFAMILYFFFVANKLSLSLSHKLMIMSADACCWTAAAADGISADADERGSQNVCVHTSL